MSGFSGNQGSKIAPGICGEIMEGDLRYIADHATRVFVGA
jgi:hypothetical protein